MARPKKLTAESRTQKRIPIRLPAKLYLSHMPNEAFPAEILDLSEGGAFVHCTAPIRMDDEVRIEIQFKVGVLDKTVEIPVSKPVTSKVRWARGSSNSGFGIEFTDLTDEKRDFIRKILLELEKIISPK